MPGDGFLSLKNSEYKTIIFKDFARLTASCSLCEARASSILSRYTDKTKQAKLATGKDVFAGVAVYSDNLEQKPTGVVYDGTVAGQAEGEMEATMTYQVGQMMPVMQGGVCWVRAGEDVAATSIDEEVECNAAGVEGGRGRSGHEAESPI